MPAKPAKFQILDKHGNVIQTGNIKTKTRTINGIPVNPEFEKPLFAVTLSNPFKKILYWLDQIRKRQTTTLAFKLSIPLIALPVIIAAVFSLGRISGISFARSLQGTVDASPKVIPSPQPTTISKAGTLKIAKGATKTSYLLSLRNGSIISLEIPPTIDLTKYQNKQVLVTGAYYQSTGTLKVTDIAEIEVYNPIEIPESSQSAN